MIVVQPRHASKAASRPRFPSLSLVRVVASLLLVGSGCCSLKAKEGKPEGSAGMIPPGAMVIDGKLEEQFYATAQWNAYPSGRGEVATGGGSTRFSLHTDGTHLYFSAAVTTPDGKIVAKQTQRDGGLSKEDSVELFLQCGVDPSEGYQFLVNALGTVADYQLVQGGLLGAKDYNAEVVAATLPTEKGWNVEMAIPLSQLDLDASRRTWGLQVATNHARRDETTPAFQAWSPVSHTLRELKAFGTLKLPGEVDLRRFSWNVAAGEPVILRREGSYYLQSVVEVTNRTDRYRIVELSLHLRGEAREGRGKVALAAGKRLEVTLEVPLGTGARVSGDLVYRLSERAPEGGLLKTLTLAADLQYTPWKLELVDPGYRQTIFATQKLTRLRARLRRTDPGASAAHLAGELIAGDQKEWAARFNPLDEQTWEVEIPGIADLPEGKHRLVVTIGKGGEAVSMEREITKLPYQQGETWIDALGVVRREGVALPFYGYCFGNWGALDSDFLPGFSPTMAGPVATWADGEKRFVEQLGTVSHLADLGIYSLLDVATATKAWRTGGEPRRTYLLSPLGESEKEEYLASIERMKGNPSIIAYYLADEPELHAHTPRRLGQVSDLYRRNDPYKPVLVVNNTYHGLVDYLPTSDIAMPDRYPVFRKGGGSSSSLAAIEAHLKAVPIGSDSHRARWAVLQACDYEQHSLADGRAPTAREMRSQQISALIGGATGITWYKQTVVWDLPGVRASLPYLEKEFRWVFESRQKALPKPVADAEGLQAALLEGANGPMLLVVNPQWKQVQAKISDPLFAKVGEWQRVGGTGRSVTLQEGAVSFALEPHESAILIPPSRAGEVAHLDWLAVEREEARVLQESRVRGNLAHRDNGTVAVGIPETGTTRYSAFAAIDGMKSPKAHGYRYRGFQPGNGIELRFPEPKPLRRIVVYGTNLLKGHLEVRGAGETQEWKKVASLEHDPSSRHELEVALSGESVGGVRLVVGEILNPYGTLKVVEIEAYE